MASRVQHHIGEYGQIEVVRNPSLSMLLSCGTREMNASFMQSLSEDDEDDDNNDDTGDNNSNEEGDDEENRDDIPNRRHSLMGDEAGDDDLDDEEDEDSIDVPREIISKSRSDNHEERDYHPSLMPAVIAEGQEAMWVEDEVSTVASIVLQSREPVLEKTKKNRFRFRSVVVPTITIPEDKEVNHGEEHAQKLHVRKIKTRKTIVLLPQQGDDGAKTLVEANVKEEAAMNMVRARHLLDQALVAGGEGTLEISESLAKTAFAHATAARRLMSKPEDEPDLEDELSVLVEKGEQAALQHIASSRSSDSTPVDAPRPSKKRSVLASASDYASRAKHYLESILPNNIQKDIQEHIPPVETISTLGLKTDTFEYQLGAAPSQANKSYTNMDLMSISSLNEILDGPLDESNEKKPPSPRQMLPIINVPNRTPKTKPSSDAKFRHSFSGELKKWVSPRSPFVHKASKSEDHVFHSDFIQRVASNPSVKEESINKIDSHFSAKEESIKKVESHVGMKEGSELKQSESTSTEAKRKRGWGIMRKLRGGKQPNEQIQENVLEHGEEVEVLKCPSSSSEPDRKRADLKGLDSLPTVPSKSFDSDDRSKFSRYHVIHPKHSDDLASTAGTDFKSASQVDDSRLNSVLNTTRSDWDQSIHFERSKVKPVHEIIRAPRHSMSQELQPSKFALDGSLDPQKRKITKTAIDMLESKATKEQDKTPTRKVTPPRQHKSISPTRSPKSQFAASIDSFRSKDFRSAQVNTGATVALSEGTQSRSEKSTGRNRHAEASDDDDTEATITEASGSKGQGSRHTGIASTTDRSGSKGQSSYQTSHNASVSQKPICKNMRVPTICEETTQVTKDTLIDFVISPSRAKIIAPNPERRIEKDRGDEPSEILVPIFQTMEGKGVNTVNEAELLVQANVYREQSYSKQQPKIIARISSLFGTRKHKSHSRDESFDNGEKQDFVQKDINHALVDGNFMAYHANADTGASAHLPGQQGKHQQQPKMMNYDAVSIEGSKESTMELLPSDSTTVVANALNQAVIKAEEANLEVETAPFPHRKSRRHRPTRPVPLDLVDAIRLQAGLERKKVTAAQPPEVGTRESFGDAPGISMDSAEIETPAPAVAARLDPPKADQAGYRNLAPTPRKKASPDDGDLCNKVHPLKENKKEANKDDDKHDQWKISERLYGPSFSLVDSDPARKRVATKGVYIGDLIFPSQEPKPSMTTETEEDDEDEEGIPAPPPPSADPKSTKGEHSENEEKHVDDEHDDEHGNPEEKQETEDTPADKENSENIVVSPKAGAVGDGTTPRRRLGKLRGTRKSMLSGIRNLMLSPSGGAQ